jgi:CRISPR-associated protein Csb3
MLDYACVLRLPAEYRKARTGSNDAVEPFYFDARRFAHALDIGFSLDKIRANTVAHPAVELLALIGLQRFRPKVVPSSEAKVKARVEYSTWHRPLGVTVAAAAACGAAHVPGCRRFRFKILARDDQKRYGAFGWATARGGEP